MYSKSRKTIDRRVILKSNIAEESNRIIAVFNIKEIYDYLYDAKLLKNNSIYDYSAVFSEDLVQELISYTEEFLDKVEQFIIC